LSDRRILAALKAGTVVISPFRRENLSTSSYDVALGEWYFREQKPGHFRNIFNLYDRTHTEAVWGTEPSRAETAATVLEANKQEYIGIKPSDKVIVLEPGETILAHTDEFIGGREQITTMMKARSSLGRCFIEVCKCAGWGDVGYINRWTMEITNNSRHYTIPLVVGRRVAQLIFFETGPILKKDYSQGGKYQSPNYSLSELEKSWQPTMMLPRLWADREVKA
ncbi:MAG: hypothetical protein AAB499_00340, partial [Patescibacteria group bacterium]